jgi:peptidoglycan hydrolase CwlO-like protein
VPFRANEVMWRAVVALALAALVLILVPGSASAVPSTSAYDAAIAAKKAEQAAVDARLKTLKVDLQQKIADYQTLGRRMEQTRAEMSVVTTQLAQQEIELATVRQALADRAIQLYRGDSNGMLEVILTSRSLQDLIMRTEYVVLIGERDADLMSEVRKGQAQTLYLQGQLSDRFARLTREQLDAETQRAAIVASLGTQQKAAATVANDVKDLMSQRDLFGSGVASPTTGFDENTVISEANFVASGSLTVNDIQAFLDSKPGVLKSFKGPDHNGQTKTAAQMIAEACANFGISPKVILVTLQKEQSLLTATNPSQTAMDWAMGCGKTDSKVYYEYQGFGKQVWGGASKFQSNANLWTPSCSEEVDSGSLKHYVHPTNPGTLAQWRYTPHTSGVTSFWNLYWRYFGDPLN